ncbi:hypothetical protein M9R32_10030 [Paenisporosarcina quisquiliarum]|uniref:Uncharacterized protein n=1 Tax=Paenisporosarcina quisquiliarum TaxID=365346 RepID=A0A9X3LJB5_9BACL|nr:hypothetical protein [Paenisporosarcina quisquiliarum]MCZ8537519.1 hypothetical protein [Paenisporosarcina quisquiliarum]
MKKIILLISLLFVILCTLFGIRYGQILTANEGTIRLGMAAAVLDFTGREYVKFEETEYVKRYITEYQEEASLELVKNIMSNLGWSYETQEGAALFFRKDKDTIVVETEVFLKDYFLWDMPLEASDSK